MRLPIGEVSLHEVMEWAQEQSQFLSPPQTLVLWYLCINAFRSEDNPEGRPTGAVLSGRCSLRKIQMGTNLSERAVRDALRALQANGYVLAQHQPGHGKSKVDVFWTEKFDEMRAEFRAGKRTLPKAFERPGTKHEQPNSGNSEAVILDFRTGTTRRKNRHDVPQ